MTISCRCTNGIWQLKPMFYVPTDCLSKRIREQITEQFDKDEMKEIKSSLIEHLIDLNHSANPHVDLKTFYRIHPNLSRYFLKYQKLLVLWVLR